MAAPGQGALFPTPVRGHVRGGGYVKGYLRQQFHARGAPGPNERGYRPAPWDGREPGEIASTTLGLVRALMEEPELLWAYQQARGEVEHDDLDDDFVESLADMLDVPKTAQDGGVFRERDEAAVWLAELAMETDPMRWSGMFDRQPRGFGPMPLALAEAIAGDAFEPGKKLRLVNVDVGEAREFIAEHHSKLPDANLRGLMYAIGVVDGANHLVAVATAGHPTGRWDRGSVDPKNVVEITRVASDGTTKGAASMLVARLIDILDRSKRGDPDAPSLLVTYQFLSESGTMYRALRDKGLRPTELRRGKAQGAESARSGGARDTEDKIRWEAGPAAAPARWDLLDIGHQEELAMAKRVTVAAHLRKTRSGRLAPVVQHQRTVEGGIPRRPVEERPTVVELYAGAGGLAYGLRLAGWRSVALIEHGKHPAETLRRAVGAGAIHGEVIEGDANAVDYTRWKGADLVAGGPPCQPYSKANMRREGSDDPRDGWPTFLRAVEQIRPRYVLGENAPTLLSDRFQQTREAIEQRLGELGYDHRWTVVHAEEHGVPQRRRRSILLAWRRGETPPRALPEIRPGLAKYAAWDVDEEALDDPTPSALRPEWLAKHRPIDPLIEPASTVVANHKAGSVHLVDIDTYQPGDRVVLKPRQGGPSTANPAQHESEEDWEAALEAIAEQEEEFGEDWWGGEYDATVVDRQGDTVIVEVDGHPGVWPVPVSYLQGVRRTKRAGVHLRRAWQGFPPQWPFAGPKTAIDEQIGNAVPVGLAEVIGRALLPGVDRTPPDMRPEARYIAEVAKDPVGAFAAEAQIPRHYAQEILDMKREQAEGPPAVQEDLFKSSDPSGEVHSDGEEDRMRQFVDGYGQRIRLAIRADIGRQSRRLEGLEKAVDQVFGEFDGRGDAAQERWREGEYDVCYFAKGGIGVVSITHPSMGLPLHVVVAQQSQRRRFAREAIADLKAGKTPERGVYRAWRVPRERYPGVHGG